MKAEWSISTMLTLAANLRDSAIGQNELAALRFAHY